MLNWHRRCLSNTRSFWHNHECSQTMLFRCECVCAVCCGSCDELSCAETQTHRTPPPLGLFFLLFFLRSQSRQFRVYTQEVIEVSPDTAFLLVVPDKHLAFDTQATASAESPDHITLSAKYVMFSPSPHVCVCVLGGSGRAINCFVCLCVFPPAPLSCLFLTVCIQDP